MTVQLCAVVLVVGAAAAAAGEAVPAARANANMERGAESFAAAVYQSSGTTGDRLTRKPDVVFTRHNGGGGQEPMVEGQGPTAPRTPQRYVVRVNASVRKHAIIGFGGAFTEAAAITLQQLRPALAQQVIDAYFGPDGIHYTLTRVHMGR